MKNYFHSHYCLLQHIIVYFLSILLLKQCNLDSFVVSVLLVCRHDRERQILKMALEQRGVKCLEVQPSYQSYMMVVQFKPDVIILELPRPCSDQLYFAGLLRKQKKTKNLPIIGYGDQVSEMEKRGYVLGGVNCYLQRPLKFSAIVELIERFIKVKNKKLNQVAPLTDKQKDMEDLLNSTMSIPEKLEIMTRHVSSLVAFPFTVAKVLHLAQDERTGAGHLAQAITADPAITTHILKLSNSVFFSRSSRRINSVKDAIVRIGFTETKKIVMSMSVINLFDSNVEKLGFNRMEFWTHSLSCAVISERIAKNIGAVNAEEAFLAGLLHDLGMLFFDEFFPSVFQKILQVSVSNADQFIECEKKEIGVTHNDLIGELFPRWKIPDTITEAILSQYDVEGWELEKIDSAAKKMAVCVFLADMIAKSMKLGRECDAIVSPVSKALFVSMGLGAGLNNSFVDNIFQSIEMFRKFLKIEETSCCDEKRLDKPQNIAVINQREDLFVPPVSYLEKEGWQVDVLKADVESSSMNQKYDVIIVWGNEKLARDQAEKFSKVLHPASDGNSVLYSSLVVIAPKGATLVESEKVKMVNSRFDLQYLAVMAEQLAAATGGLLAVAQEKEAL